MNIIDILLDYHYKEGVFKKHTKLYREDDLEEKIRPLDMSLEEREDFMDIIIQRQIDSKEDGYKQGFKDAFKLFMSLSE